MKTPISTMKTSILISIFMIFLVFGHIRAFGEIGYPEANTVFHVSAKNTYDEKLEDVRATVFIPELGIVLRSNPFTLREGESKGQSIELRNNEIPPGEYTIRFTASNDRFRNVRHRNVVVG